MTMRDDGTPHSFATDAHAAFKRGGGRRLAWAAVAAAVALALLVLLGPEQEDIKRRFEYYGAPGELRIMPEISIDDGRDARRQLPRSLNQPPPPAEILVEEEPVDPDAEQVVPKPREGAPSEILPVADTADAESAERSLVEMALPMQSNPDYFILEFSPPEYPLDAPESERRLPRVFVSVEAFLGPDGRVADETDVVVRATNGGPAYSRAVIKAMTTLVVGWRVEPGAGRWFNTTFYFNSPYFTPGSGAR